MAALFVWYVRCSTCVRAKKWLEANGVEFTERSIVDENPNEAELTAWIKKSGLPVKKFFNTSGKLYREHNMKDFIATHSEAEQIAKLAENGMLVKRPIVVTDDCVLVGFKEETWGKALL